LAPWRELRLVESTARIGDACRRRKTGAECQYDRRSSEKTYVYRWVMTAALKAAATFVFQGTVKREKASNVKVISDTSRTAIVTVNKIISAPAELSGFVNQDVTVQLTFGERVRAGQVAVFYTNGLVFGENLAVRSEGHDPVKASGAKTPTVHARGATAAFRETVEDHVRADAQRQIRKRVNDAPVVVSGKVVAVGLPAAPPALAAAADGLRRSKPISEHDPLWHEAVVEVDDVHKGSVGAKQVVLRFPSSTDVRWSRSPKFRVGQTGVFTLRPDVAAAPTGFGVAAEAFRPSSTFTCLDAADFQPADQTARVATAIAAAKGE